MSRIGSEQDLARGRGVIHTLAPADQEFADVVWEQHCLGLEIELIVRSTRHSGTRVSDVLKRIQMQLATETARGAIISVGYEGRALDEFVALLVGHAVDTLVDVRMTPLSRKKGFSKQKLSDALESAGIAYVHERELGNPKDNRQPFRDGNLDEGRARFFAILDNQHEALDRLAAMLDVSRVALLCFERDHDFCHRSCIAERVAERQPAIEVVYA